MSGQKVSTYIKSLTLNYLYYLIKEKGYQNIMSTYFSLIPSGVLENEKISDGAKITYALILGLSNRHGYCFASNDYLSKARRLSESGIKRHLTELKSNGCIVTEYNSRNDRRITPNIYPSQFEKASQKAKNKAHALYDYDDIDNALDQVWKNIK